MLAALQNADVVYDTQNEIKTEQKHYEQDEYQISEKFFQEFNDDIQLLVKDYISRFFKGKEMHCGGSISDKILHSEAYVLLVMTTDVCHAVPLAYEFIEDQMDIQCKSEVDGVVTEDVKLVISILQHAAQHKIPKCYAAGLMLMYLELCRGLDMKIV